MSILGNNIRYLRLKNGYSQEDISSKLGYRSYTTVQKWENESIYPPVKVVQRLSALFGVDTNDLLNKDLTSVDILPEKGASINVFSCRGFDASKMNGDSINTMDFYVPASESRNMLAFRIEDDSMFPQIKKDDIIFVRRQPSVEDGKLAAVAVNNEVICRKIKKHPRGIVLTATNPVYDTLFFTDGEIDDKKMVVIGKVIELRAWF